MKLYLSPMASYLYQTLKSRSVPYAEQVKALLRDIQAHPLEGIDSRGMVIYFHEGDYVVIISIMNELLPSHEELPLKLQEASKEDYAQMIRQMEANRGHGDDPKVGIFWYNVAWKELFGVVSHPVRDYTSANASDGRITCSELHEDVWRREYNRQKRHGDGSGPFIGPYENKPRGRVFYLLDDDRYMVMVGKWLEEYPDAKEQILAEFDLPPDRTTFEYAIHWDIGQTWR